MSWFKVDDGFNTNPKTALLSDSATVLWLRAGVWSCRELTDGFIPEKMLPLFREPASAADELVEAELWEKVENGWKFHDWSDYQPTGKYVLDLKEKRRVAGRKGGLKSAETRWGSTPENDGKQDGKQTVKQVLTKKISKTEALGNPEPVPVINNPSPTRACATQAGDETAPPSQPSPRRSKKSRTPSQRKVTNRSDGKPKRKSAGDGEVVEAEVVEARTPGGIDDWNPTPAHYEMADRLGVDCADQAERMRDWYKANRPSWKNFDSAFNNWLRHAADFGQKAGGRTVSKAQANQDANMRLVMRAAAQSAASGGRPAYREEDFR